MKTMLKNVLLSVGVLFLLYLFFQSRHDIQHHLERTNLSFLALSLIVGLAGNGVQGLLFRDLMKKYGVSLDDSRAMTLFFYGQIAKYIPGRVWSVVMQRTLIDQGGSLMALVYANVDQMIFSVCIMSLISLNFLAATGEVTLLFFCTLAAAALSVTMMKSRTLARVIRYMIRHFRARETIACQEYGFIDGGRIATYFAVNLLSAVAAYYLLFYAVFGFTFRESAFYISCLGLSWLIGAIALVVPAGMGVREGVFIVLSRYLGSDLQTELLVSIAVIVRCWVILQDVGGAALVYSWNAWKSRCSS
jgi:hypothetical protein